MGLYGDNKYHCRWQSLFLQITLPNSELKPNRIRRLACLIRFIIINFES